jgi:hypothetical protein
MWADINYSYLLSAHADADHKNHYLHVRMQIMILKYADTVYIYIFSATQRHQHPLMKKLLYLENLCFVCYKFVILIFFMLDLYFFF